MNLPGSSVSQDEYNETQRENLLIIDDNSLYDLLAQSGIFDKFEFITASSLFEANRLGEEYKFKFSIVNSRLKDFYENENESSLRKIPETSWAETSKLIIITAFDKTTPADLKALSRIPRAKIVRHLEDFKYILEKMSMGDDEDIINTNFDDIQSETSSENNPRTNLKEDEAAKDKAVKDEGLSTYIASDMWTTDDALGYEDYAYAIYKFMTHENTKPPLTISIQAPWGGGKTSLMRMIRKYIDPEADAQLKEAARTPNGELKLKEAVAEIKRWIDQRATRKPLETKGQEKLQENNKKAENLTIWFNAWKYENANQVWAGLIDAVMQQVAARLPVKERELFWLRLNLKRVDTDKIRKKIHSRVFNYFLRGAWFWVVVLLTILLPGALVIAGYQLKEFSFYLSAINSNIPYPFIGAVLLAAGKYLYANAAVNNEPAAVSLNDYLEIPNYGTEFGFIHRAEIDLKHVLESIPEKYKPLVIFIDDLDRCSPTKISQVVEAVNLFLAGDFPQCMFVIGMDTEMVAAALQSAHKDMIDNLPADLGIPVGWRFMDKFVQLPFLIPPLQHHTKSYIDSLFSFTPENARKLSENTQKEIAALIEEKVKENISFNSIEEEAGKLVAKEKIRQSEALYFQRNLQTNLKRKIIDSGVEKFTDRNEEIRRLMNEAQAFEYFTGNPRELKRFVNAFRFNYFLWWAQRSQGAEVVSLEQLIRWTILSMKWAELVRWLRRSDGSDWETSENKQNSTTAAVLITRLKVLENFASLQEEFSLWQESLVNKCQLDLKTANWLNDEDLFHFFKREELFEEGKRLSDGIGKGIW